ncbi:SMI1/KNR4 family protein [Chitinivorax sp. B]|uniref:SMI1/KNR4 family protein n=1 Tax=Chitinivorax sp. B TaxID=2502235 RepID=UPI0010F9E097|nr:SMI1/KNR4 family protein [Chitinivorax sp. B]
MIEIGNHGRTIIDSEVVDIEKKFNVIFPEEYRAFLLKFNGGTPEFCSIDIPGMEDSPTDVKVFFGIDRKYETSNIDWNIQLLNEFEFDIPLLPIASDSGGSIFCIECGSNNVVFLDMNESPCAVYEVAKTFEEFLSAIRE